MNDMTRITTKPGCSWGLPSYGEPHGILAIHGRAAAVGTGMALANPALDMLIFTGDLLHPSGAFVPPSRAEREGDVARGRQPWAA